MEKNKNEMLNLLNFIKYPLLTEKSINLYGNRQYTFIIDKILTKTTLKVIIEKIFNVTVTGISTSNLSKKLKRVGKSIGRKSLYKKAIITLKEGDKIAELFN